MTFVLHIYDIRHLAVDHPLYACVNVKFLPLALHIFGT
jgi:hypothetical protein